MVLAPILSNIGCESDQGPLEYSPLAEITSANVPPTVDEAMRILNMALPDSAQRMLVKCEQPSNTDACRFFIAQYRLPLERHISNAWLRSPTSTLYAQLSKDGFANQEDMVAEILRQYVQKIQ